MKAELVALLAGMALLVLGAASIDWRLGVLTAGAILILSAVDFRGVRR